LAATKLTPPSGRPQRSVRGSWREFCFVVFVIFALFVARFEIEDKKFSHKEHKVHKAWVIENLCFIRVSSVATFWLRSKVGLDLWGLNPFLIFYHALPARPLPFWPSCNVTWRQRGFSNAG
jgi:hypothetical protein